MAKRVPRTEKQLVFKKLRGQQIPFSGGPEQREREGGERRGGGGGYAW